MAFRFPRLLVRLDFGVNAVSCVPPEAPSRQRGMALGDAVEREGVGGAAAPAGAGARSACRACGCRPAAPCRTSWSVYAPSAPTALEGALEHRRASWCDFLLLFGRSPRRAATRAERQEREQQRGSLHVALQREHLRHGWRVRAIYAGAERVEPAQDLDRLGAQRAVLRPPVRLGELAGAVVELGVADLGVLGLLGGLERVPLAPPPTPRSRPRGRAAAARSPRARRRRRPPRPAARPLQARLGAAELLRHARGVAGGDRPRRAARRRPEGDQAAAEHDQRADPDPAHQRRDDQPERRRRRVLRVRAGRGRRAPSRARSRAGPRAGPWRAVKTLSPSAICLRRSRTLGEIALQTSRRSPARRPTSLVASPSKKRETGPSVGSSVGKNDCSVRSVPTRLAVARHAHHARRGRSSRAGRCWPPAGRPSASRR